MHIGYCTLIPKVHFPWTAITNATLQLYVHLPIKMKEMI